MPKKKKKRKKETREAQSLNVMHDQGSSLAIMDIIGTTDDT